ncbi:hypothetical protein ABWK22_02530 [Gottfriedia acidiceleris]|uniref:DUF4376 domain-containing protein n=1 Tax=Gottfriedia acidiceleris TaxID=371036 RepID=UPI003390C418
MLTSMEEKLIEVGFDMMDTREKNLLISVIANNEGLSYNLIDDQYILDYHKKLKSDQLSLTCDETIIKGFEASNGHFYRTNRDDQVNMIGQKDELMADPEMTEVFWKTEDAGYIKHPKDEWLTIYTEAFAHKKKQLYKYNNLKQQVLLSTEHGQIVNVNWDKAEEVVPVAA